ncbi:MAG: TonB-dependent receptor plug domain-containing protein [Rhodospirillaceae bacterium]|nr:TonB-dependent receptor plug domain-containing protein [Rhodospirillaceae bacterium]
MDFKGYRSSLITTTSALALAVTAVVPALAQDQQAQGGLQLEEIIVNARRVDENIQRVPIAITAFSPEKLAAQDVKDIWTLTKNIGGVNICCSPGNTSFIFVRGIGNGTPTYFNDVPAQSDGFSSFFDVSSVQVLKGPQGTLFGQASNAGALVYQPRKPGDVFGGYINVTAGNYGRRSVDGAIDIPIVEDKVLFRMAAQSFYREGFVEDIRTNRDLGDQNYYILRPSLVIRPNDDIENYTLFQLTKQKGRPLPFVLTDINFSDVDATLNPAHPVGFSLSGTSTLAGDIRGTQRQGNLGLAGTAATWYSLRDQVLARQIALGPYKVDGYSSGCNTPLGPAEGPGADPFAAFGVGNGGSGPIANLNYARAACQYSWSRNIFFSNTTTWNFADKLSLKNIFGYRTSHSFSQPGDTDGTPLILFDSGSPKNGTVNHGTPVWSDELQLQGTKLFDFLDFTVGTFHTGQQNKPVLTYGYALGVSETAAATKNSSKSRGVYGQANIDIGHFSEALAGLSFTAGYRYTWDHLTQIIYSVNPANPTQLISTLGAPGTASAAAGDARFSAGVYTFQLQYQWTPDIMIFFNNSKGYSAGGLQDVLGKQNFSPDVLTNYEGGIKGTFDVGGVKIRTATSYFYGDYSNIKVSVTQLANRASSPTAPASLIVVTENAATGYITGLDSDLTVVPTDWLEVGGNLAYTKTKYTKWDNFQNIGTNTVPVIVPVSFASAPFSFVPKWKWSLRGTVHLPVDQATIGDMSFTANYTHTGVMYNVAKPRTRTVASNPNTGIVNTICRTAANGYGPLSADGKCVGVDQNQAYHNLDLNFDWRDVMGNEGLNASVFVTNVTKNIQNDGGCYCNVALGLTSPAPQVPRMFGVKLGYSF